MAEHKSRGIAWTPAQIEALRQCRLERMTERQTQAALGGVFTIQAIRSKASRMGFKLRERYALPNEPRITRRDRAKACRGHLADLCAVYGERAGVRSQQSAGR